MKYFKYDLSLIIPIYNEEKYIGKAIESVLNQDYNINKIEIILIDDGSTDRSSQICLEYMKKHSNIKFFQQKKAGVSTARNLGISKAKGKYITFLDADDYLLKNTVKSNIAFFENHYNSVDLICYPLFRKHGKKIILHSRYQKMFNNKCCGIYDINELYYFLQLNINIFIKNFKKDQIKFNEKLLQGEDADFILRIISQKNKLGYNSFGGYIWRRHHNSTTTQKDNPYYMFDEFLDRIFSWFEIKNKFNQNYIDSLIMYEFGWKLKNRLFFPTHLSETELNQKIEMVKKILTKINYKVIINHPFIDKYHKAYFLELRDEKVKLVNTGNQILIINKEHQILFAENYLEVIITKVKFSNSILKITAFLKSPIFNFFKPKLFIKTNDRLKKVPLKISNHSNYKSRIKTNNFWFFEIELNFNNDNEFAFEVFLNKQLYPIKFFFHPTSLVETKHSKIIFDKFYINFNKNIIKINQKSKNILIKNYILTKKPKIIITNIKTFLYKTLSKVYKNKKIWLYNDRDGLLDNAFYQFKNDFNKTDGVKRYYIVDGKKNHLINKLNKQEKKAIIKYKSLKHKLLFIKSKKIFTSFNHLTSFCPFGKSIKYYDLYSMEIIYLQHGILHANLSWLYSKEKNYIDKIVVSSQYEIDNLIANYNYNRNDLILSGQSRFDIINDLSNDSNKILFALSWRSNLIGPLKNNRRELKEKQFLKSKYFTEVNNFLNSDKLKKLLKANNLELKFLLHPIFKGYNNLFEFDNKRIEIIDNAIPGNYKLLITDYSSIVFDYIYCNTPVIYFIPDYFEFRAGISHNYNKLDLPLENGFGPLTFNENSLIYEIESLIKANFKIIEKYNKRYKNFFMFKGEHRERLYNEITKK